MESFEAIPGHGIESVIDGVTVLMGTRKLLADRGVTLDELVSDAETLENEGKTVMYMGVDGVHVAMIAVADTLKETSKQAIAELQELGLDVIMLTGDQERTANAIAKLAGIEHVIAGVLPERKAQVVAGLQAEGKRVAMVGDGINDAPALAVADIGMAMGTGTA